MERVLLQNVQSVHRRAMNHPFKKFGNPRLASRPFGAGSVAEFGFLFFISSFLSSIGDKSSERE